MTTTTESFGHDGWAFEPAEPSVGIFHESLIHECFMNVREEQAVEADVIMDLGPDGLESIITFYRCPVCNEQTVRLEQQPAD